MKKIILIISLCLLSVFFLQWKKESVIDNLLSSVEYSDSSRSKLLSVVHLYRAQSFFTGGLTLSSTKLLSEASENISKATSLLKDGDQKQCIKELYDSSRLVSENLENSIKPSEKEYIEHIKKYEDCSYEIFLSESDLYKAQFISLKEVVNSYHVFNIATLIVLLAVFLIFVYIIRSEKQRRKYVEEILALQKLQGKIFATLNESIFVVRPDGIIETCNESAAKLVNENIREIVNKSLYHFFPNNKVVSKGYSELFDLKYIIESGRQVKNVNVLVSSDREGSEESWYRLSTQPMISNLENEEESYSLIVSLVDITKQVSAAQLIKDQQYQLMESSKLQTIGELAGGIAHEINNPLTVMLSRTNILERAARDRDTVDSKKVTKSTASIRSTIERISKTVTSLLKMSHGGSDQYVTCTLGDIFSMTEEFVTSIVKKCEANLTIDKNFEEQKLHCNPTLISQVLINLIKNSCDAISNLDERWISVECLVEDSSNLIIKVIDSGNGIPDEMASKILLPYFTTKEVGKGTGLGLSLSRNIIEGHQGTLEIDMKAVNTTFIIKLPIDSKSEPSDNEEDEFFL